MIRIGKSIRHMWVKTHRTPLLYSKHGFTRLGLQGFKLYFIISVLKDRLLVFHDAYLESALTLLFDQK